MSYTAFSIAMVILIGLLSGTVVGLLIGFLLKKQTPLWSDMTSGMKWTNFFFVAGCSAVFIAGLAWTFLLR